MVELLRVVSVMLHLAASVLWIGGVGFVTTVVLPRAMRTEEPMRKAQILMGNAEAFRKLALIYIAIVGVTGFVNMYFWGFPSPTTALGIKIYLMIVIYVVLTGLVLGMPKLLGLMREGLTLDQMMRRVYMMHWLFLALGLVAVMDGVAIRML